MSTCCCPRLAVAALVTMTCCPIRVAVAQDERPDLYDPAVLRTLERIIVSATFFADSGRISSTTVDGQVTADLSDPVVLLRYIFQGGAAPGCEKSADADDSGSLELTDSIYALNFLFLGGSAPAPPGAACGFDRPWAPWVAQASRPAGSAPRSTYGPLTELPASCTVKSPGTPSTAGN